MPSTFNDIIDGVSTSLAVKAPVQVASTSHLALSGLVVVEGVQTTVGMRILVNAQNNAVDNGIYTAETGAWRRAKDFDGTRDAAYGTTVFVSEDSQFYRLITPNPVVIGEDEIHWVVTILSEEAGELLIIDNVDDLRLTLAAADGQTIGLAGYYEPGDAPFRTVRWDAASTLTDDGGRVFQVIGIATGRWLSTIDDFMDLRLWGAVADDTFDNYEVFNRALNSVLRFEDAGAFNENFAGNFLLADVGVYYCSDTLHLKHAHSLRGGGTHIGDYKSSIIRWPQDKTGIVVHTFNTDSTGTVANGSSADGSEWDGIGLAGGGGTLGVGVWLRGRAILRNCNIRGFALHGVFIHAFCGGGGLLEGNANNWFMDNVRSQNNGGHGIYVIGTCANAGVAINCHGDYNGGWGIYDSSFLGNAWVQCHTAGNTSGGYKGDNSVPRTFINPYAESGQPASEFGVSCIVIGGVYEADPASTGVILNPAGGLLRNTRGYQSLGENAAGEEMDVRISGDRENQDILYATHEIEAPNPWRLRFDGAGNLLWDYGNSAITYRITGPTTAVTFGQSAPVPNAFQANLYTRTDNNGRRVTHEGGVPSSGVWAQGDIIFNINAAAGGAPGWVCTTSGTAGVDAVFKAMANLAA